MKKKVLVLILCLLFLICLSSCKRQENNSTPVVSVRVVTYLDKNYLEWSIKNYDKNNSILFKNGDITNFSIKHIATQKIFSNENTKAKDDYILKPQGVYREKISLEDLKDSGEYEADFWAKTDENIKYETIVIFNKSKF